MTLNPAKLLRIDDKVGSIAIGKHADLVIWSHNPLSIYAVAEKQLLKGLSFMITANWIKKLNKMKKREIIITQLKEAKKGGKTQPAPVIDEIL